MWYAVQVRTGEEEKIKLICEKLIAKDILAECFIPYCERMKKYLGSWHLTKEKLFPGYVFMISDFIDDLRIYTKKIPNMIRILGDGSEIIPLSHTEIDFLKNYGEEDHSIRMSMGYILHDKVVITEGPMKDFVGVIKKVNRHKRVGIIELDFFGRTMEVQIGLEIISKVTDESVNIEFRKEPEF